MDTAGKMLRFVDTSTGKAEGEYGRLVDKGYGTDEYREVDNAGCCWEAPFVTDEEYNELYDTVMSLSGAGVRQLDVSADMERKPNRVVDKKGKGDDLRIIEIAPEMKGLQWVDLD
jgi:hypothetical protein